MDHQKLKEFTAKPLLATLATISKNGAPQLSAVWYDYDGQDFIVVTSSKTVKVRNIRRDNRVTLCVVDSTPPPPIRLAPPLVVTGRAYIEAEKGLEATRLMCHRYMGLEGGDRYFSSVARPTQVVIRIVPERFVRVP